MSIIEQINLRDSVIKACARSVGIWLSEPDFNNFVRAEPYFIKWGDRSLHHHAETQKYVYDQASQDSSAPRIPEVHDCFDHGIVTYLVMEYIPMLSRKDATSLPQRTADAIDWLRRLPPPPGARIGPLGGGYACHKLFQGWSAPLRFSCSEALETYLNKVRFYITSHRLLTVEPSLSRISPSNIVRSPSRSRTSPLCSPNPIWRATSISILREGSAFSISSL